MDTGHIKVELKKLCVPVCEGVDVDSILEVNSTSVPDVWGNPVYTTHMYITTDEVDSDYMRFWLGNFREIIRDSIIEPLSEDDLLEIEFI